MPCGSKGWGIWSPKDEHVPRGLQPPQQTSQPCWSLPPTYFGRWCMEPLIFAGNACEFCLCFIPSWAKHRRGWRLRNKLCSIFAASSRFCNRFVPHTTTPKRYTFWGLRWRLIKWLLSANPFWGGSPIQNWVRFLRTEVRTYVTLLCIPNERHRLIFFDWWPKS